MSAFITMNLPTLAEKGVWIILRVFFSLAKTYLLHSLLCIYESLCFFDLTSAWIAYRSLSDFVA